MSSRSPLLPKIFGTLVILSLILSALAPVIYQLYSSPVGVQSELPYSE